MVRLYSWSNLISYYILGNSRRERERERNKNDPLVCGTRRHWEFRPRRRTFPGMLLRPGRDSLVDVRCASSVLSRVFACPLEEVVKPMTSPPPPLPPSSPGVFGGGWG